MANNKTTFEQWLDGQPVDQQTKQSWETDPTLKAAYESSLWLQHQADCMSPQPVPQWDAQTTFAAPEGERKWLSWFTVSPMLSMAMSIVAILMVLFKVELHMTTNGVLLTFAGDNQRQMEQLVTDKIAEFGREQQILMAHYVDDIQAQQQQDVTQLASYLISASRKERKEEFGALVSFLNDQREEDKSLTYQKFSQMIYNMNQKNTTVGLQPAVYNSAVTKKLD